MSQEPTVLIVDDEAAIRDMINIALDTAGFKSMMAETALDAHVNIVDNRPDLVLLDWMLPGGSGIDLARRLKREELTAEIPIIMLTAKTSEDNKVQGLDVGVDDYITKPFSPRELIARIKAVLRRSTGNHRDKPIRVFDLELDPASHRVSVDSKAVDIGPTEYRLLHFFMTHPEKVFSRDHIQDQVWGANVYLEERTVDVHIGRLRKALTAASADSINYAGLVQTVRGAGYRFSTRSD
ncbi:MAG: phosphate regulon transcriptional regulator PhoB [Pseudohongiella nitratireducens]|nr:phosphate regulon transcriptional regulator PhoB [Pseudohongiella nitratireducens]MDF1623082.1 phosphate regulon transcriptional regulator PhoB [Pseudohongiella nitratireducens]